MSFAPEEGGAVDDGRRHAGSVVLGRARVSRCGEFQIVGGTAAGASVVTAVRSGKLGAGTPQ